MKFELKTSTVQNNRGSDPNIVNKEVDNFQSKTDLETGNIHHEGGASGINEKDSKGLAFKRIGHQILVTLGLVFGIFIGGMSETAVSTVTEVIGQDMNSLGSLTWIAGGYLLTTVAFTPLFGKVSDIFGRKLIELLCIVLFAAGSLGCALANSMIMLIIFRVIAGIGGGGLISMSFIMVSDVISIESRSTYLGFVSITFAISQVIGPIIGGIIAEASWRIIFYLLLPLSLILALLVIFVLDLPKSEGDIMTKVKRVDFLGSISIILGIICLILATTWGGSEYEWNSTPIIVLFVLMVVFFISFLLIQWKVAAEPLLPARVFVRNVILANISSFMGGGINLALVFYLPIYFQFVHGASPSVSGYHLAPFLGILSVVCLISGYLAKIFNSVRGVMWVGGVITTVGICLITFMRQDSTLAEQIIFVMILGVGIGCIFQLAIYMCTLSVAPEDAAIASGFSIFAVNIGGVIALAIVGSVYNNMLIQQITANLPDFSPDELLLSNVSQTLSPENQQILRSCYYMAFRYGFICLIPFAIILLFTVLGLTKVDLPKKSSLPPATGH